MVSALTRFRDVFAFGLLGVAVLYLIGGLSLLAKSEDDLGLGFTDRAAAFGYLFMHPLLIVALATSICLAVGLGQPSRNAKPAVILALVIGGVAFVVGLVSWFSAFGGEDVGSAALYGGVLGAGKVVAVFLGLAQLIALGLVLLFGVAAYQVLPKPAPKPQQWGPPQQYGWGQQQGWQQQPDPGAWGAPVQPPPPQQVWGQPSGQQQSQQGWGQQAPQPPVPPQQVQQSWGQPPAQPGWGQPQQQVQQSWGQPADQSWGQPADQSWGQPADQSWGQPADQSWGQPAPEPGQHAWRPDEDAGWSGTTTDDSGAAAPSDETGWTTSGDDVTPEADLGTGAEFEAEIDPPTSAEDDLGSLDQVDTVDDPADATDTTDATEVTEATEVTDTAGVEPAAGEPTDGQQDGWWQRPNS